MLLDGNKGSGVNAMTLHIEISHSPLSEKLIAFPTKWPDPLFFVITQRLDDVRSQATHINIGLHRIAILANHSGSTRHGFRPRRKLDRFARCDQRINNKCLKDPDLCRLKIYNDQLDLYEDWRCRL
jgi:hypothetical protein